MIAASPPTTTALAWDQAVVVVAITAGLVLLGWLVMLARSIFKGSGPDKSFVRSWITLALVVSLILFWAVTFAVNDPTLQGVVFVALIASTGAAVAAYFYSKSADLVIRKPQLSLTRYVIVAMLAVGRWRRKRAYHDSVEFANAGPPSASSMHEITRFMPALPPPDLRMLTEQGSQGLATLPEESGTTAKRGPDHGAEQPEELDQVAQRPVLTYDKVAKASLA